MYVTAVSAIFILSRQIMSRRIRWELALEKLKE
jgi:hypothetical protein